MSTSEAPDARAEANRRYDGDTIIDENTGEPTSHDDWGYAQTARDAFLAGAKWAEEKMPPIDAGFLKAHRPSRWRSFTTDEEVLRCCGQDFGPVTKRLKRGSPDAWDLWADHVAASRANEVSR